MDLPPDESVDSPLPERLARILGRANVSGPPQREQLVEVFRRLVEELVKEASSDLSLAVSEALGEVVRSALEDLAVRAGTKDPRELAGRLKIVVLGAVAAGGARPKSDVSVIAAQVADLLLNDRHEG